MIRTFYTCFVFCIVKCSEEGNCTIRNRLGELIWFCCDNHEIINDTCHECLDGFESVDGMPCELCKYGNYGRKCGTACTCLENQTCDHIIGCINIEQSVTPEVSEFTEPLTYTSTDQNGKRRTSLLFSTFNSLTFMAKHSPVMISTRKVTSTTPQSKANDLGFNNREIIVYTICASIFVFFILLCTVCQRRYKQIYGNLKSYRTNTGRRNIPENQLQEIALEDVEPIYEVIDESNMIDNLENFRDSNRSITNITDSISQPDNNGYLTPYQPADENTHDNYSESSSSSNTKDQTLSYRESTSSNSDLQDRSSSYLNPYQPIVPFADNHEYSYTHKRDDSSSSGSGTTESGYINPYQPIIPSTDSHEYSYTHKLDNSSSSGSGTTESGYINPYQPMISDIDVHEYKCVQCSHESDSSLADMSVIETRVVCQSQNNDINFDINIHENKSVNEILPETVSINI